MAAAAEPATAMEVAVVPGLGVPGSPRKSWLPKEIAAMVATEAEQHTRCPRLTQPDQRTKTVEAAAAAAAAAAAVVILEMMEVAMVAVVVAVIEGAAAVEMGGSATVKRGRLREGVGYWWRRRWEGRGGRLVPAVTRLSSTVCEEGEGTPR